MYSSPGLPAARRMQEAAGWEAKTIHRLVEYSPQNGFKRNRDHPLAADAVIIAEASMIDTVLMYRLAKAIPLSATLVLVGEALRFRGVEITSTSFLPTRPSLTRSLLIIRRNTRNTASARSMPKNF